MDPFDSPKVRALADQLQDATLAGKFRQARKAYAELRELDPIAAEAFIQYMLNKGRNVDFLWATEVKAPERNWFSRLFGARSKPDLGTAADVDAVTFLRIGKRPAPLGKMGTDEIYKAPTAASAQAFLEKRTVGEMFYTIMVETPEGKYAKDLNGVYEAKR